MHKGNNRAYVTLRDESRDISGKWEFSGVNFVVPVTSEFSAHELSVNYGGQQAPRRGDT